MIKPGLGIKRTCSSCKMRFYDFDRSPIICPGCGTEFDPKDVIKIQQRHIVSQAEIMVGESPVGLKTNDKHDTGSDMVFDENDVEIDEKDGPGVLEDDISDGDELLPNSEEKDD